LIKYHEEAWGVFFVFMINYRHGMVTNGRVHT